jgi:hypothetical protein
MLKAGMLGLLAASVVGCGSSPPTVNTQPAPSPATADLPALTLPDAISESEMFAGDDPVLETQQRVVVRRPTVRWRRTVWRGTPYFVPYNYYWWAPRPFYRPVYSGSVWWGHTRPGFRHPRVRIRRW